jgi:hypothetical protein
VSVFMLFGLIVTWASIYTTSDISRRGSLAYLVAGRRSFLTIHYHSFTHKFMLMVNIFF